MNALLDSIGIDLLLGSLYKIKTLLLFLTLLLSLESHDIIIFESRRSSLETRSSNA